MLFGVTTRRRYGVYKMIRRFSYFTILIALILASCTTNPAPPDQPPPESDGPEEASAPDPGSVREWPSSAEERRGENPGQAEEPAESVTEAPESGSEAQDGAY